MSFTAQINANTSGFSQGVDKASKDIEKLEKDVSARLAKVGDQFLSIGKSASVFSGAIAAAATGVFVFSKRAGDMASDLLSATVALDSSADMLQEYEFIASQAGTSTEAFSRGVEAMTRRLKDAGNEGDNTSQLINGLGVAMNNADGSMRRTGDIANDIVLSLAEMSNVSERNVIASQLFGRAWVDIAPILDGGADGIEGVRAKAHELGLVLDGDALDGMANFSIEANKLGMQFSAIGNNLASQFAPLLSETIVPLIEGTVIPAVQGLADKVGDLITWFQELPGPAQKTVLALTGVAAAIGPVMLGLGGLIKMLPILRAGFAAMTGPVGLAVAAVSALAIGLAVFASRTKEVSSVSAEFSRELSEQTKALDDNFSKLKETASGTDSRRIAIEEINSKYGPYLDNLLTEKSSLEDIEKAQKKATQELAKSIAFKAQQSDLSKFRDAIANSETEFSQALKQLVSINEIPAQVSGELAAELDKMMGTWSETDIKNRAGFGEAFAQVFKDAGVEIDLLGKRGSNAYQGLFQSMQGVIDARQDERKATEDLSAAYDGYLSKIGLGNEAYSDTVETVEELGNGLEGVLQGNEDISEVIARTVKQIAELTQRLEGLRSGAIAVQDVRAEIEETEDRIKDLNKALNTLQGEREIDIVMKISGNEGGGFDSMIEDITTRAAASMDALQATLSEKMNGIKESVGGGMVDLSAILAQGVTSLAESIGTAFATGDWDNMGNELLAAIGGLAQQFGATLISMGFAALALRVMIGNPFTAIAAGIALVALGAAATAAASKQVSAATGGGSGGGGGGSTGYRDTASPGQSEYRGAWQDDFRVEFVQKGSDLVGVLDAAEQRRRRS